MKKGFIIAAAVWLASLAVIAIGYSIFQPRSYHINWSPSEFLDPAKFFVVGLPILAIALLFGSLRLLRNHEQGAKTMVQMAFTVLIILSATAIFSLFGLLMAPAAWFAYQAMASNGQTKAA